VSESGVIVGYDPGGNGFHGIAQLMIEEGEIREASTQTLQIVEEALQLIQRERSLVGLGLDTLTSWNTGLSGWRPADRRLRNKYAIVKNSIISPNSHEWDASISEFAAFQGFKGL
jgi:hypothetical protein